MEFSRVDSYLPITYHIVMTSLFDVLPDSGCGVWGFSPGFAKNVICGYALHLVLLWLLLFGMDSRWRSEKTQFL